MSKKPADRPLTIKVVDDQLVISIGVSTLAYALQNGPEEFGAKITNDVGFARDVARELEDDGSEGDTAFQRLLDEAANRAIEGGSQHVVLDGDSYAGIHPSQR